MTPGFPVAPFFAKLVPAGQAGLKEFQMHRHHVNKRKSAGTFRKHVSHTKSINMRGAPMRGGIRL